MPRRSHSPGSLSAGGDSCGAGACAGAWGTVTGRAGCGAGLAERCRASPRSVALVRAHRQGAQEPWKGRAPTARLCSSCALRSPGSPARRVTRSRGDRPSSLSCRALAPRPRPRSAAARHEQRLRRGRHPGPVLRTDPVGVRVPPLQAQVRVAHHGAGRRGWVRARTCTRLALPLQRARPPARVAERRPAGAGACLHPVVF